MWRIRIVAALAKLVGVRRYDSAKQGGHVWGGGVRPTASPNVNDDLAYDLSTIRERARHAWENSATARAVVEGKVALVVSTGIDVEPDTKDIGRDTALHNAWSAWCEYASACGGMSLWDLQRQACRGEEVAGEWLWVLVDTDDYDRRGIPRAIMPVEPDRLAPEPVAAMESGATFVAGREIDKYGRVIAFHILDGDGAAISGPLGGTLVAGSGGRPGASIVTGSRAGKRYEADRVIHGFEPKRPGQQRGEPGLAPILNTLRQELQLVEAELTAAKVGAAHSIKIKQATGGGPFGDQPTAASGTTTYEFTPGSINFLAPGEDAEVMANPRPSQQIAPFRGMLAGDMSGATGVPRRYINRDVSQANYSSMRADMLDTRRILDPIQQRFGRQAAGEVYRRILPLLAVAAGVQVPAAGTDERRAFESYKLMPDGWAYVDPEKDYRAATLGIAAGLTTWQDELHSRGKDPRATWKQLKSEQDEIARSGIKLDLSGTNAPAPDSGYGGSQGTKPEQDMSPEDRARMERIERMLSDRAAPGVTVEQRFAMDETTAAVMGRAIGAAIPKQDAPTVEVRNEIQTPAPTVHVTNDVRAAEAQTIVVHSTAPVVNVAPTPVEIENNVVVPQRKVLAVPNKDGSVMMTPQES